MLRAPVWFHSHPVEFAMTIRAAVALAVGLWAVGLAAADPPRPPIAFQTQSVSRLLADAKELIRQAGGPEYGEKAVRVLEEQLKNQLGERGLEGLDINRPLAGYLLFRDAFEDTRLVLAAPVTGEKEFVTLLGRLTDAPPRPVAGQRGLYRLEGPGNEGADRKRASHLRFVDGWAYLTLNDGEPTPVQDLVPPRELYDPTDANLASLRLFPGRLPEKLVKAALEQIDQRADEVKMLGGALPGGVNPAGSVDELAKLLRRGVKTAVREVDEVRVSIGLAPGASEIGVELTVFPKAGSPLARAVRELPPTTNRFAGLLTPDTTLSVLSGLPRIREFRDLQAASFNPLEALLAQAPPELPDALKTVVSEAVKGMTRTLKDTGRDVDAAVVLYGPDAGGQFTLLVASSFDDPTGVDKAVRQLAEDRVFGQFLRLDAAKAGKATIHQLQLAELIPDGEDRKELRQVFGEKPQCYVALAPDAVFVTFGSQALNKIKEAVAANAGPAAGLDVSWNGERFGKLLAALSPEGAKVFARQMGPEDRLTSLLRITSSGGETFRLQLGVSVTGLVRAVVVGIGEFVPKLGAEPGP